MVNLSQSRTHIFVEDSTKIPTTGFFEETRESEILVTQNKSIEFSPPNRMLPSTPTTVESKISNNHVVGSSEAKRKKKKKNLFQTSEDD
jgi:hypothetical protein